MSVASTCRSFTSTLVLSGLLALCGRAGVAAEPSPTIDVGLADVFGGVLPGGLDTTRVLGMKPWQWLGIAGLAAIAVVVSWLLTWIIARVGRPVLERAGMDRRVATSVRGPLQLLAAVTIIAAGLPFLRLAKPIYRVLVGTQHALIVLAFTWLALRALDVLSAQAERRFTDRRHMAAVTAVPLGRRVLKVVIAALAVVAALQNFGFNVTGLAAGLGIGGLAIALAAQKTVENLFGGVTLITDQPVRVGDYCRFGTTEGLVEDIGLRSTRLRTLDRTVITIPNAQFSAMPLENLSRRDRIPVRTILALRNETGATRVREILERLRAMLSAQPKVDTTTARARLIRISPQATEIEIFANVLTSRWSEYVEHREHILLGALEAMGSDATTLK